MRIAFVFLATLFLQLAGTNWAHASASLPPAIPKLYAHVFPAFLASEAMAEERISSAELAKLRAGEVVIQRRPLPPGRSGTHAAAMVLVEGSVGDIMATILDCASQPQFVPHLVQCQNSYPSGQTAGTATRFLQHQRLKLSLGFLYKEIRYTNQMFLHPPFVSGWEIVEGDLEESAGYWRVIPYEDGRQILVYAVYNRPGIAVPTWVKDILVKTDLPATVEAFRRRIESTRTIAP